MRHPETKLETEEEEEKNPTLITQVIDLCRKVQR